MFLKLTYYIVGIILYNYIGCDEVWALYEDGKLDKIYFNVKG